MENDREGKEVVRREEQKDEEGLKEGECVNDEIETTELETNA